jgi:hypothetical protein
MKETTVQIVLSALKADPEVSPELRKQTIAFLRSGGVLSNAQKQRTLTSGYITRLEASKAIGRSVRTVDELIKSGALKKVTWPGRVRAVGVTRASLEKLLANGEAGEP